MATPPSRSRGSTSTCGAPGPVIPGGTKPGRKPQAASRPTLSATLSVVRLPLFAGTIVPVLFPALLGLRLLSGLLTFCRATITVFGRLLLGLTLALGLGRLMLRLARLLRLMLDFRLRGRA